MYSALRWLRPASRNLGMVCCATSAGGGKPLGQASAGKSAMNLFLMDFAAAPETCCAIMPLVRERKGSISSARPMGEKTRQWCLSMRGLSLGSMERRWLQAVSRSEPVVVVVGLDGEGSSKLL